ncbi:MAG: hypothetical protein H6Q94_756, partial [Nitrospirae bacterium]|nr:hypothetical protein [Nitrospirota bacterium]
GPYESDVEHGLYLHIYLSVNIIE